MSAKSTSKFISDIRPTKFGFCPLLSYAHLGLKTAKKYAPKKMRFLKINEQSLEYLMQLKKNTLGFRFEICCLY